MIGFVSKMRFQKEDKEKLDLLLNKEEFVPIKIEYLINKGKFQEAFEICCRGNHFDVISEKAKSMLFKID